MRKVVIILAVSVSLLSCAVKGRIEEKVDYSSFSQEELKASLIEDPQNPLLHYYLARSYTESGLLEKALQEYKEALHFAPEMSFKLKPLMGEVHLRIGETLIKEKRWQDALKELKEALAHNPELKEKTKLKEVKIHIQLARKYTGEGQWEEAISQYQKAAAADPRLYRELTPLIGAAQFKLGERYMIEKKYLKSVSFLRRARANSPRLAKKVQKMLASLYATWGRELKGVKKYQQATARFKEAAQRNPGDLDSRYHLAEIYWITGRTEEAISLWKELIEMDSGKYPQAREVMGEYFLSQGDLPQARRMFEELVRLRPYDATFHYILGGIYSQLGSHREAYIEYRKAIISNPVVNEEREWQGYTTKFRIYYHLRHILEDYILEALFLSAIALVFLFIHREKILYWLFPPRKEEAPLVREEVIRLGTSPVQPQEEPEAPLHEKKEEVPEEMTWEKLSPLVRARLLLGRGRVHYPSFSRQRPHLYLHRKWGLTFRMHR